MAIITLAEYKTHAGLSGTADDTRLQNLIDSAHAAVRRYCGRDLSTGFESTTYTQDYETDAGELQLREFPVTSITSITPIDSTNTLGTALDSSTYRVESRTGIVKLNGTDNGRVIRDGDDDAVSLSDWGWQPRFGRVRVVYVASAGAADVDLAICRMVDMMLASVRNDPRIGSQSLGNWSVTYAAAEESTKAVAYLLDPFRDAGVL